MKVYYDLHIHSVLSPCGDELMTPNNIVNMAKLKNLDIIAVSDHNSNGNLKALSSITKKNDLLFIPAIEAETIEGIHVLCLFEDMDRCEIFNNTVKDRLPNIENNIKYFGPQILMNERDEEIGVEERLLALSSAIEIDDLIDIVHNLSGLVFPAHIDKQNQSILSVLGFVPNNLNIDGIEVSNKCQYSKLIKEHPEIEKFKYIINSDAHYLGDISERVNYIDISSKSIKDFFDYFR